MTKLEAMRGADCLLKNEQIPHCLEARFNADMVVGIWAFFSDVGGELADVAKGRLSAEGAFQRVLEKGWSKD